MLPEVPSYGQDCREVNMAVAAIFRSIDPSFAVLFTDALDIELFGLQVLGTAESQRGRERATYTTTYSPHFH